MFKSVIAKLLLSFVIVGAMYLFLILPLPWAQARPALGESLIVHSQQGGLFVQAYRKLPEENVKGRVILVPSAGREASDFNELVTALTRKGYETIALDGHGINGPFVPEFTDLSEVAEPVLTLLKIREKPTFLIGHAYGNRVVRAAASANPQAVKGVILLAAGGYNEIEPAADKNLKAVFNPVIIALKREGHVRQAFFAPSNHTKPLKHWKTGWHTKTAIMQGKAKVSRSDPEWEAAGGVPMLVVQAAEDRITPKADTADILKTKYPNQVSLVLIENAGHALLPEQPEAIATAVTNFLKLQLAD